MTTSFSTWSADIQLHKTSYASSLLIEVCTGLLSTEDTEVLDCREHVEKMLVHAYHLLCHPFLPYFSLSSLLDSLRAEVPFPSSSFLIPLLTFIFFLFLFLSCFTLSSLISLLCPYFSSFTKLFSKQNDF